MSDFYATAAHVLPETASDERMHVLDDRCWCHPIIDTDAWQIQHQRPTTLSTTEGDDRE
jgi:hypothetical protein